MLYNLCMKKKILITPRANYTNQIVLSVNKLYAEAIIKNGAIPFVYSYDNYDLMDEIIKDFDGLLVIGGDDINSKYWDEPLDPTASLEPDFIDETDLGLIKAFMKAKKPILGICRGIQVINVACGGSLYQDLNTSGLNLEENHHHQGKRGLQRTDVGHIVKFDKDNIFYDIYGEEYTCNTYHHQAVNKVGDGLKVVGYSDDGVVEALVGDKIMAVQYHPEWLVADSKHNQVFVEFLKMCQ